MKMAVANATNDLEEGSTHDASVNLIDPFSSCHANYTIPGISVGPSHPANRKRVRFSLNQNVYHEDKVRTSLNECRSTWFTDQEYKTIACEARLIKLEYQMKLFNLLRAREQGQEDNENSPAIVYFSAVLSDLLRLSSTINFVVDDVSRLLTPQIEEKLRLLYVERSDKGDNYRFDWVGLECFILDSLRSESKSRYESIQEVVSDIEAEYNFNLWTTAEMEDELRDSCRNFSQAHGLMAQLIARARYLTKEESL